MNTRWLALAIVAGMLGCGPAEIPTAAPSASPTAAAANKSITLAAGTTIQDSGLFDVLIPRCLAETGIEIKAVPVGTGQALEIAKRGDADALLTHSPAAEKEFLEAGWAESREEVFWNDFLIAGPKDDLAGVAQAKDALGAFGKIHAAQAPFVSRGDDSGNHKLELKLWKEAELENSGGWYLSVGAGMAQALRVANEKRAYVLVDRGTWLAMRKETDLVVHHEGDPKLVNQHAVLVVSPAKHPQIRVADAREFANWLRLPATKEFIAAFGKDKYGEALFKIGSATPQ
jgi:tungstate transport system substrate-binding protein